MSHLEQRLENDLQKIRGLVAEQTVLVEKSVSNALHSLQTDDRKLANTTVLEDLPINRNMRLIDSLCHKFIAVHLPSAGHLRLLSSVIRANIELERIGDYAVTIAREGLQMSTPPTGAMASELERMSGKALLVLKQACTSLNQLDAELARSSMVVARQMEHNLDILYAEMMAKDKVELIRDAIAIFIVFTQLKRVTDQSKNLCEETVFAVTGEQKEPKVYSILFIDEDNSLLSQMAEAVGRINFPESGRYRSAGRIAASSINDQLKRFLQQRGLETEEMELTSLDELNREDLANQMVIISLQGPVENYLSNIPFRTVAVEWKFELSRDDDPLQSMELLYREMASRITDLMKLLRGEEAR